MTKAQNKLLIVVLFGWLGIHKFMEKNSTMGWAYLFTFGLFGIGWIVDIAKSLFDVINENQNTTRSQNTDTKNIISQKPAYTPPAKPESEKNYDLFDKCIDNYYLAYEYEEKIVFPKVDSITGNGGKKIVFKQEPDNEYDNKAVALYLD